MSGYAAALLGTIAGGIVLDCGLQACRIQSVADSCSATALKPASRPTATQPRAITVTRPACLEIRKLL